jgi:hypothetical protein
VNPKKGSSREGLQQLAKIGCTWTSDVRFTFSTPGYGAGPSPAASFTNPAVPRYTTPSSQSLWEKPLMSLPETTARAMAHRSGLSAMGVPSNTACSTIPAASVCTLSALLGTDLTPVLSSHSCIPTLRETPAFVASDEAAELPCHYHCFPGIPSLTPVISSHSCISRGWSKFYFILLLVFIFLSFYLFTHPPTLVAGGLMRDRDRNPNP